MSTANTFEFYLTKKYKHIYCAVTAIFFYLFILMFLPFGVDNYNPRHQYTIKFLSEIGLFPVFIYLTLLINEFGLKKLFTFSPTSSFVVLWSFWSLLLIGSMVFTLYNYLGNWHDWSWSSAPKFVFDVSKVMIFPMIGIFFYFKFKTLQENFDSVLTNIDKKIDGNELIQFIGQGTNDKLAITASDFIFARAQDNYTEINYLENNVVAKFLIRASMTSLADNLNQEYIFRCHRSYIVNLYQVKSIKGGRNDLSIQLNYTTTDIPISKTYTDVVLAMLHKYKNFSH